MQSICCINYLKHAVYTLHKYIKKSLELIIHPFLPQNSIQSLVLLAFFFTFAPAK